MKICMGRQMIGDVCICVMCVCLIGQEQRGCDEKGKVSKQEIQFHF